jgi:hypothetical protein
VPARTRSIEIVDIPKRPNDIKRVPLILAFLNNLTWDKDTEIYHEKERVGLTQCYEEKVFPKTKCKLGRQDLTTWLIFDDCALLMKTPKSPERVGLCNQQTPNFETTAKSAPREFPPHWHLAEAAL